MTRPRVLATHRARLVLAFMVMCVLTAGVTAGVTLLQARSVVLGSAQDTAVSTLRSSAEQVAPELREPLDGSGLRLLVRQLDPTPNGAKHVVRFAASSGGVVATSSSGVVVPTALVRTAESSVRTLAQTIQVDDASFLVVAVPIVSSIDAKSPGLVVYSFTPLAAQNAVIGGITTGTALAAIPVVIASALLALVIARNLLQPVRRLQTGVEELSTGRLGAQIPLIDGGEFGELAASFNAMSRDLRSEHDELRAMEEKARRFTADVSHELRTPLAAMTAVVGVLTTDAEQLPEETSEAVLLVAQETRNLARLVEDLIEISRFDAGTAQLRRDEIDLAQLVERTLAIRDWTQRVTVDVTPGLRARVDPRRVDVILANLIGNAVRYGGPDATISIRGRGKTDGIRIVVSDDGDGIPVSVRARVFDRFVKGDPTRARSEGSGLGLSIARENALLHGGSLDLEDSLEKGTTFVLCLPHPALSPCVTT
ncbi:HAMP domain-containing histidine kinase [Agreia pratensis]|uniref:sensor histidine kinase n=1 Tax=Agreia pratensis TaxID=150121 RepID=UPI00188D5228|nr:HAMP domain-containing sensor histidine kinase [Agreia pratensis]MBF4636197.1 HAMP domain-containing histidine kinase [Agreia pratensis]